MIDFKEGDRVEYVGAYPPFHGLIGIVTLVEGYGYIEIAYQEGGIERVQSRYAVGAGMSFSASDLKPAPPKLTQEQILKDYSID